MTQSDPERGRWICQVGAATLLPAPFVIVLIGLGLVGMRLVSPREVMR